MARVTVEDCLENVENRFALVVLAAKRARQLAQDAPPLVICNNKPVVTALREIAEGLVTFNEDVRSHIADYIADVMNMGSYSGSY